MSGIIERSHEYFEELNNSIKKLTKNYHLFSRYTDNLYTDSVSYLLVISFNFIKGDSGGPLICVVSDRATLVGETSDSEF